MVICPIGGGPAGGGFTVTVVDAVFVPPSPMTVTVYCKVVGGHTCRDPPAATLPIPWSIETADVFVADQVRSARFPLSVRVLSSSSPPVFAAAKALPAAGNSLW